MWLARKKANKKPRKKRRNAKARYDKEYPVVPIRLPKSFKKQLAKEAEKKDLMISQYMRDLLQGFEIRERVIEKIVDKPVIKTVIETVEDPKKLEAIRDLKDRVGELEETVSSKERELRELRKRCSKQQEKIASFRESNIELRERSRKIGEEGKTMQNETICLHEEIKSLRSSLSLNSENHNVLVKSHHQLKEEVETLTEERSRLKRQLDWVLKESKRNDGRNERIARRISQTHEVPIRLIKANWDDLPE